MGGKCQDPLPGFAVSGADDINGNDIRVLADWEGRTDISSLGGRPIRSRFLMRDTKPYSFQFLLPETTHGP